MGTVFGHWRGKKEVGEEDEDTEAAPAQGSEHSVNRTKTALFRKDQVGQRLETGREVMGGMREVKKFLLSRFSVPILPLPGGKGEEQMLLLQGLPPTLAAEVHCLLSLPESLHLFIPPRSKSVTGCFLLPPVDYKGLSLPRQCSGSV